MNVSALYATRCRCSWRLLHCKCSQWQYSKHLLWYVFTGLLKAIDCVSCWCVLFAGEFVWFRSGSVLVLVALQRYACLCIHTIVNVPYYMVRGCSETFQVNRKCCSCVSLLSDWMAPSGGDHRSSVITVVLVLWPLTILPVNQLFHASLNCIIVARLVHS